MQVLLLLFGNLADFHLGTWHVFVWELGRQGLVLALPNHLLNVFFEVGGCCGGREALDDGAVARNEKLGEDDV